MNDLPKLNFELSSLISDKTRIENQIWHKEASKDTVWINENYSEKNQNIDREINPMKGGLNQVEREIDRCKKLIKEAELKEEEKREQKRQEQRREQTERRKKERINRLNKITEDRKITSKNLTIGEIWERITLTMTWQVKTFFIILLVCILTGFIYGFMQSPDIVATFPRSIISLSENLFFISLICFLLYLFYFFFYSAINLIKAVVATVVLYVISFWVSITLLVPLDSINSSVLNLLGNNPQIFSQRIITGIIFISVTRFFYILGKNKNTRNSRFFGL
ncbi:MAG: hypothetical protein F6K23_18620 [Okeania sp. SIO2C9]|uniref:hypothetical protein n=1 Tax=Okeania sp. SIO2C9 TaxID=2607791 RepID=UPI0013C1FAE9|nr:hypothetical protein [Okeania sp. SIO2C9]NEQ74876.1 hypothetical protein [Okeania sp. SIO2C9]